MKVFLLKDVERVGKAGHMISVPDGYARNFIIPRKLGIEVTESNKQQFDARAKQLEKQKEGLTSQQIALAARIKELTLVIKRKVHDGDKLYGAIAPQDIVDLLAEQGIDLAKNQIVFGAAIKKAGSHSVTIAVSPALKPTITLTIVPEST